MERKRILVVDGHRDAAQSLCELLKLNGYETYLEVDGLAALSIAAECRPDVVILDIRLPGCRGADLCRRLRAKDWGRRARIIVMTASSRHEDRATAREAGCDVYLLKPVPFEQLEGYLSPRRHPPEVSGGCGTRLKKPWRTGSRPSDS